MRSALSGIEISGMEISGIDISGMEISVMDELGTGRTMPESEVVLFLESLFAEQPPRNSAVSRAGAVKRNAVFLKVLFLISKVCVQVN